MLRQTMVVAVGVLTVASAFVYAYDWVRHMGTDKSEQRPESVFDERLPE
ncbi:MAG: hypothetical protein GY788_11525 [bacterium]|nr:hypothetical protein [bacterium]